MFNGIDKQFLYKMFNKELGDDHPAHQQVDQP